MSKLLRGCLCAYFQITISIIASAKSFGKLKGYLEPVTVIIRKLV